MQRLYIYFNKLLKFVFSHKLMVFSLVILLVLIITLPMAYTFISTRGSRYDLSRTSINNIPYHKVGIVFGAGILPDGLPTPYLQHRIDTAIKLYRAHRINILLMSGDNSTVNHNEPLVMENYALSQGVPMKSIVVDDAGFDTYDSCYRAHVIFKLTNATLISQGYHLPRAMTTCKGVGIENIGVVAIHPTRDYTVDYILREFLATDKMVIQLIFKPHPTILGPSLPL